MLILSRMWVVTNRKLCFKIQFVHYFRVDITVNMLALKHFNDVGMS